MSNASDSSPHHYVVWGTALGLVSAVGYTLANTSLRELAGEHSGFDWSVWVTCVKAIPATLVSWVLIAYRSVRGLPALPPRRMFGTLVACGLMMQFGGNVCFQVSLGYCGLALSVPLCFATIILSSAWLGKVYLKEKIDRQSLISMALLMISFVLLSAGTNEASAQIRAEDSWWNTVMGILTASVSGVAYGVNGIVIRRTLQKEISLSATLVWLSTVGVVALGLWCWMRMGTERLLETTPEELRIMSYAGLFNAVAFFAIGAAMKYISVLRANLINTSQIAMCSVVGVMWFSEPLSKWLISGTVLTIIALVVLRPPSRKIDSASLNLQET